jgi:hypothetical protein
MVCAVKVCVSGVVGTKMSCLPPACTVSTPDMTAFVMRSNVFSNTVFKGKAWIRIPSIIYSSMLLTNVLIILGEELAGEHPSPHFPVVLLANLPWLLFPLYIFYRMGRSTAPFTRIAEPEALPQLVRA